MPNAIDEFLSSYTGDTNKVAMAPAPAQPASPTPATQVALATSRAALANTTPDEFQAFLNRESASQLKPFDQLFGSATNGGRNTPPRTLMATPNIDFVTRNERVDLQGSRVPLDVTQGLPLGEYGRIAEQTSPEAKLSLLHDLYPDRPARLLDSGEIAIQLNDPKTGDPKDILLNPRKIDAHDLIDLATQTPEIAAATATAILTEGTGFIPTLTQIVASSIAGAVTKQARSELARYGTSADTHAQSVADLRSNSEEAILNGFFQVGGLVAAKALRGVSPFAKDITPDSMEFNVRKAQQVVKDEFGLDYPLTAAEKTGSPALRAVESLESSQPGARTVMGQVKDAGNAVVRAVQNIATRGRVPDEQLGEQAIQSLTGKVVQPIEDALTQARSMAEARGQQRLVNMIDNTVGSPSGPRVTPTMAGTKTLEEFDAKLAQAHIEVNAAYDAVKALPGGTGDILEGNAAATAATEIRKELPTAVRDVTRPTGLLDAHGKPLNAVTTERQQLGSGIPDGLNKALTDLESLQGARVSLQTLNTMKNAAFDEIAKTEAVPGVKDRWFKKIAAAYSQGIESGVAATGDPTLKAALTNAKDTYKRQLLPFDRPGLRELARSEFDAGHLSSEQIASRFFEGPKAIENYQMLKETLGASSSALKTLKRAWLDTKIASLTDDVTGVIDAAGLGNLFKEVADNKPELATELFGTNYKQLAETLRVQAGLQGVEKLDAAEAKILLSLKNPGVTDLEAILRMQKNRATAYFDGMLGKIADGLPVAPGVKPTEFIKHLYNVNTPTKEVQMILDHLAAEAPDVRRGIATTALYRLLDEASIVDASTASTAARGGAVDISATKLAAALGKPGSPEQLRYRQLFGDYAVPGTTSGKLTNTQFVETLIDLVAPRQLKSDAFGSAGSLAKGSAISKVVNDPLSYALNYVKKAMLATIYISRPTVALASNRLVTPATSAVIANSLIAAEPIARGLVEAFGPDKAKEYMANAKASIDTFVGRLRAHPTVTPATKNRDAIDQFLRGYTNAPVKLRRGLKTHR